MWEWLMEPSAMPKAIVWLLWLYVVVSVCRREF